MADKTLELALKLTSDISGANAATAAINNIANAANSAKTGVQNVSSASSTMGSNIVASSTTAVPAIGDIHANVNQLNSAIDRLIKIVDTTKKGFTEVREEGVGAVNDINQEAAGLSEQLEQLKAALLAAFAVDSLVAAADAFSGLQGKIKLIAKSTDEEAEAMANIIRIANSSYMSLDAVGAIYTRLSQTVSGTKQEIAALSEVIVKAAAVSGGTAETQAAGIEQLAQAFGNGRLNGEEFNSVGENTNYILQLLSKSLGKNIGELRGMAEAGQLTTDVLKSGLIAQVDSMNQKFADMEKTIGGAARVLQNSFIVSIGNFDEATGASNLIAAAIKKMADNMDQLILIASGGALAGAASMLIGFKEKVVETGHSILDALTEISTANREASEQQAIALEAVVNKLQEESEEIANSITKKQKSVAASKETLDARKNELLVLHQELDLRSQLGQQLQKEESAKNANNALLAQNQSVLAAVEGQLKAQIQTNEQNLQSIRQTIKEHENEIATQLRVKNVTTALYGGRSNLITQINMERASLNKNTVAMEEFIKQKKSLLQTMQDEQNSRNAALAQYEQELQAVKQARDAKQNQLTIFKSLNNVTNDEIDTKKEEIAVLDEKITTSEREIAQIQTTIKEKNALLEIEKKNYEQQVKTIQQQNQVIEKEIKSLELAKGRLLLQQETTSATLQSKQAELDRINIENAASVQANKNRTDAIALNERLLQQSIERINQLKAEQSTLAPSSNTSNILQQELQAYEAALPRMKQLRAQLTAVKQSMFGGNYQAEVDKAINLYKQEISALTRLGDARLNLPTLKTKAIESMKALESQVVEQQKAITEAIQSQESLTSATDVSSVAIANNAEALKQAEQNATKYRSVLDGLKQSSESVIISTNDLQHEIDVLAQQESKATKEIESLEQQITTLQASIQSVSATKPSEEMVRLASEINKLQNSIRTLDVTADKTRLIALNKSLAEMQKQAKDAGIKQLTAELDALKARLAELNATIKQQKTFIKTSDSKKEIDELIDEIHRLEQALANARRADPQNLQAMRDQLAAHKDAVRIIGEKKNALIGLAQSEKTAESALLTARNQLKLSEIPLRANIQSLETQNKAIQANIDAIQRHINTLREASAIKFDIGAGENQVRVAIDSFNSLNSELDALKNQLSVNNTKLTANQVELTKMQAAAGISARQVSFLSRTMDVFSSSTTRATILTKGWDLALKKLSNPMNAVMAGMSAMVTLQMLDGIRKYVAEWTGYAEAITLVNERLEHHQSIMYETIQKQMDIAIKSDAEMARALETGVLKVGDSVKVYATNVAAFRQLMENTNNKVEGSRDIWSDWSTEITSGLLGGAAAIGIFSGAGLGMAAAATVSAAAYVALRGIVMSLTTQVDEAAVTFDTTGDGMKRLIKLLKEGKITLADVEKEVKKGTTSMEDMTLVVNAQDAELKKLVETLEKNRKELQANNQVKSEALKLESSILESQDRELEASRVQIQQKNMEVAANNTAITMLNQEVKSLKDRLEVRAKYRDSTKALTAIEEKEIEKIRESIAEKQRQITTLEIENKQSLFEIEIIETKISISNKYIESIEQRIKSLDAEKVSQLALLQVDLAAAKANSDAIKEREVEARIIAKTIEYNQKEMDITNELLKKQQAHLLSLKQIQKQRGVETPKAITEEILSLELGILATQKNISALKEERAEYQLNWQAKDTWTAQQIAASGEYSLAMSEQLKAQRALNAAVGLSQIEQKVIESERNLIALKQQLTNSTEKLIQAKIKYADITAKDFSIEQTQIELDAATEAANNAARALAIATHEHGLLSQAYREAMLDNAGSTGSITQLNLALEQATRRAATAQHGMTLAFGDADQKQKDYLEATNQITAATLELSRAEEQLAVASVGQKRLAEATKGLADAQEHLSNIRANYVSAIEKVSTAQQVYDRFPDDTANLHALADAHLYLRSTTKLLDDANAKLAAAILEQNNAKKEAIVHSSALTEANTAHAAATQKVAEAQARFNELAQQYPTSYADELQKQILSSKALNDSLVQQDINLLNLSNLQAQATEYVAKLEQQMQAAADATKRLSSGEKLTADETAQLQAIVSKGVAATKEYTQAKLNLRLVINAIIAAAQAEQETIKNLTEDLERENDMREKRVDIEVKGLEQRADVLEAEGKEKDAIKLRVQAMQEEYDSAQLSIKANKDKHSLALKAVEVKKIEANADGVLTEAELAQIDAMADAAKAIGIETQAMIQDSEAKKESTERTLKLASTQAALNELVKEQTTISEARGEAAKAAGEEAIKAGKSEYDVLLAAKDAAAHTLIAVRQIEVALSSVLKEYGHATDALGEHAQEAEDIFNGMMRESAPLLNKMVMNQYAFADALADAKRNAMEAALAYADMMQSVERMNEAAAESKQRFDDGKTSLSEYIREIETLIGRNSRLGDEKLTDLRAALKDAQDQVKSMSDSVESDLISALEEADGLIGDTSLEVEKLKWQRIQADLEAKMAEAEGQDDLIAKLQRISDLRKLAHEKRIKEIYAENEAAAKEKAVKSTEKTVEKTVAETTKETVVNKTDKTVVTEPVTTTTTTEKPKVIAPEKPKEKSDTPNYTIKLMSGNRIANITSSLDPRELLKLFESAGMVAAI